MACIWEPARPQPLVPYTSPNPRASPCLGSGRQCAVFSGALTMGLAWGPAEDRAVSKVNPAPVLLGLLVADVNISSK